MCHVTYWQCFFLMFYRQLTQCWQTQLHNMKSIFTLDLSAPYNSTHLGSEVSLWIFIREKHCLEQELCASFLLFWMSTVPLSSCNNQDWHRHTDYNPHRLESWDQRLPVPSLSPLVSLLPWLLSFFCPTWKTG